MVAIKNSPPQSLSQAPSTHLENPVNSNFPPAPEQIRRERNQALVDSIHDKSHEPTPQGRLRGPEKANRDQLNEVRAYGDLPLSAVEQRAMEAMRTIAGRRNVELLRKNLLARMSVGATDRHE